MVIFHASPCSLKQNNDNSNLGNCTYSHAVIETALTKIRSGKFHSAYACTILQNRTRRTVRVHYIALPNHQMSYSTCFTPSIRRIECCIPTTPDDGDQGKECGQLSAYSSPRKGRENKVGEVVK